MGDISDVRSELLRWKKEARRREEDAEDVREQAFQTGVLATCDAVIELIDHYDDATDFKEGARAPSDRLDASDDF